MPEVTEVSTQEENDQSFKKFMEELTDCIKIYNKNLDDYSTVQEVSAPSENAMYRVTLTNVKRPATHVITDDEKAADMGVVMDFVESRQELISTQTAAFKSLQTLYAKQVALTNYVNNINRDLEKKISELTPAESTSVSATPSRPPK
jgi:hypothetical protein